MCCCRALGGMVNRIISPSQNFLKHKDPNGGTRGPQLQDSDLSAGQSRVQNGTITTPLNFRTAKSFC